MNYLAHALLSAHSDELLVGNFIADHVRNQELSRYSPGIVKGIRMHRAIDTFTDAHPAFRSAKRFFYDGFEKHSGILVDIYFDHLLARDFGAYSEVPLPDFTIKAYEVYSRNQSVFPLHSSRFLQYLIRDNIYVAYAEIKGIERVLAHLSQRIRHEVTLDGSVVLFESHQKEIELLFSRFFADAVEAFPKSDVY
jgi:acyl carrier protein phosphodiesterase